LVVVTLPTTEGTLETTVEVGAEFLVRRVRGGRKRPHDELGPHGEGVEPFAAQMAETTLDTVTDDGAADGPADREADARCDPGVLDDQVHDHGGTAASAPGARDPTQVVAPGEAMLRGEHGREGTRPVEPAPQTARLLRPLRRRADRIERPARVRMRSRNPCVL
jgi:hypothetical protein